MFKHSTIKKILLSSQSLNSAVNPKQGRLSPIDNKTREYFYFIDHNGQLFLNDAKIKNFTSCFKEKEFLEFFMKRISVDRNKTFENLGFNYKSLCAGEINYIKCDDLPVVFSHLLDENYELVTESQGIDSIKYIAWGGGYHSSYKSNWKMLEKFDKNSLFMLESSGRVYHKAKDRYGGVGLVKSSLVLEFYDLFEEHLTIKQDKFE